MLWRPLLAVNRGNEYFFRSQVTYLRAFLIYIKKIIRALYREGGDPRDIVNATLSPNDFWNISGVQSERSI